MQPTFRKTCDGGSDHSQHEHREGNQAPQDTNQAEPWRQAPLGEPVQERQAEHRQECGAEERHEDRGRRLHPGDDNHDARQDHDHPRRRERGVGLGHGTSIALPPARCDSGVRGGSVNWCHEPNKGA